MASHMQKPPVTEIQVRMDCNGCVQRIKKSLNGISGINDLYIDFSKQKLTIIGWADPEKIIKAIRRTGKIATICSPVHVEPTQSPSQPTQLLPAEDPQAQAAVLAEPPKYTPPHEQPPEMTALPTVAENSVSQQSQGNPGTEDVREDDEIYQHPPHDGNRYGSGHSHVGQWDRNQSSPVFLQEPPPPIYVTHSYNTYQPSPYVTEYEYVRSPKHTHYSRKEHYSADYYIDNGNFTTMFSDENPNACTIV